MRDKIIEIIILMERIPKINNAISESEMDDIARNLDVSMKYILKDLRELAILDSILITRLEDSYKSFIHSKKENADTKREIVKANYNFDYYLKMYDEANKIIDVLRQIVNFINFQEDNKLSKVNGIYIKTPDRISFSEYSEIINKLDKVLTKCPILDDFKESQFIGVEEGSSFIVICSYIGAVAGAATAVALAAQKFATFVKTCEEIAKINAEKNKIDLEAKLLKLEIDDKIRKDIIEKNREQEREEERELILKKAIGVDSKTVDSLNHEEIETLIFTMKEMTKLLEKGIEFYGSKTLDIKIVNTFPTKEAYKALVDSSKHLNGQKELQDGTKK